MNFNFLRIDLPIFNSYLTISQLELLVKNSGNTNIYYNMLRNIKIEKYKIPAYEEEKIKELVKKIHAHSQERDYIEISLYAPLLLNKNYYGILFDIISNLVVFDRIKYIKTMSKYLIPPILNMDLSQKLSRDRRRKYMLYVAVLNKRVKILKLLLQRGADPNLSAPGGPGYHSPLALAVRNADIDLKKGKDVSDYIKMIDLLIEYGANMDIRIRDIGPGRGKMTIREFLSGIYT